MELKLHHYNIIHLLIFIFCFSYCISTIIIYSVVNRKWILGVLISLQFLKLHKGTWLQHFDNLTHTLSTMSLSFLKLSKPFLNFFGIPSCKNVKSFMITAGTTHIISYYGLCAWLHKQSQYHNIPWHVGLLHVRKVWRERIYRYAWAWQKLLNFL